MKEALEMHSMALPLKNCNDHDQLGLGDSRI